MPLLGPINEPNYEGEWIGDEGSMRAFTRGRNLTLAANAAVILAGTFLGKQTVGAQTLVGAAVGGNVTADTIGAITASAVAMAGAWLIEAVTVVANAGNFAVYRPDGTFDGMGAVGVAYDSTARGGIKFTITDSGTDLAVEDRYTVTVSYAAGNGKLYPMNPAATDGTQFFAAITLGDYGISAVDRRNAQVVIRGDITAKRELLVYPATIAASPTLQASFEQMLFDKFKILVIGTV
jgi:hypothetical protein